MLVKLELTRENINLVNEFALSQKIIIIICTILANDSRGAVSHIWYQTGSTKLLNGKRVGRFSLILQHQLLNIFFNFYFFDKYIDIFIEMVVILDAQTVARYTFDCEYK